MELTRREFLAQGAAAGAFAFFFGPTRLLGDDDPKGDAVKPGPALANDRILVMIQLSGGNDGLSTVVPFGDDVYGRSRSQTRIPAADVLKIDGYVGLHPRLAAWRKLLDEGRLAIVQGTGYPNPNRSHFKSMDIWHAADARGRRAGYGWLGRLADVAFAGATDPNLVVHIGNNVPFALEASVHRAIAFTAPEAYKWIGAPSEALALEQAAPLCECEKEPGPDAAPDSGADAGRGAGAGPKSGRDAALARLRKVLHEAQDSSEQVRAAARAYAPKVKYPPSRLAGSLATVAALIAGGLPTRVYSVETGGFDTHTGQRARHDRLMTDIDGAVSAFLGDLEAMGHAKRVCVVAFSEFGRRVKENGSGGTDHGVAGPMFLFGPSVNGGLHGRHPSLSDLDAGDLKHTVDFRDVYATLIDDWFGADHREVLGAKYKKLALLNRSAM